MELKKGDKVIYTGTMPYKLANGQEVEKEGEELFIRSNVSVQGRFFNMVNEVPKKEEKEVLDVKPEAKEVKNKKNVKKK